MQEQEAQIAIFDKEGKQIGVKSRKNIDKKADVLKTVTIILLNGNQEVFMIKPKDSLWPGKWGGSCAGLIRDKETVAQAAQRTLERELRVKEKLSFISERYYDFNGVKRWLSIGYVKTNQFPNPNPIEVMESKWVKWDKALDLIEKGEVLPTFAVAFNEVYRKICS